MSASLSPSPSSTSVAVATSVLAASPNVDASGVPQRSTLSDKAILQQMRDGKVVIEPFDMSNLSTSSYDVTLGRYYFRESVPEPGMGIYNPYSSEMVSRVWGSVKEAEEAGEWMARTKTVLENIAPGDRVIWLGPGETILGHTNEFIGGRGTVVSETNAKSG